MKKLYQTKLLMIGLFSLFSFISEIIMFILIKEGVFPTYVLLNISTAILLGSIIFFIPSTKGSLIYLSCILGVHCLLNIVNCVMYDNCGDIFSTLYFKLIKEAARVFEFSFFNIGKILIFIGIVVGFVMLCLLLMKKNILIKNDVKENYWLYLKKQMITFISVVVIFTSTYAFQVLYINENDQDGVFSHSYLYSSLMLKTECLKNFGTWGYYAKELKNVFFSSSKAGVDKINSVNEYLSKGEIQKTQYYGEMKDKNIIMIMMESIQWFAFDEYLTPNIYNLAKESLTYSNYYSKNKTNISEMISIVGSYPVTDALSVRSTEYNFVNSILYYLGDEYKTTYVHPNTGDFYNRDILMDQLGFDNSYFYNDLFPNKEIYSWGDFTLDSESMDAALEYLIPDDGSKFYSFFTTLSTHGPYDDSKINSRKLTEKGYFNKIDQAIEQGKWENPLKNTKTEDSFRYYKAMAMDLDCAIGKLFNELEEKNILDDTIVVLFGDHNTYYDDISYLIYDSVGGEYYKPYIFKTPLIIYNEELVNEYKYINNIEENEYTNIEKFASTYNIVPTLLDLLGYEYNSNLYLGTSLLLEEDYDKNNVFFSHQGGIFNDKIYSINGSELLYTELEDYDEEFENFKNTTRLFLEKLEFIEYMYKYNLFNQINISTDNLR